MSDLPTSTWSSNRGPSYRQVMKLVAEIREDAACPVSREVAIALNAVADRLAALVGED